MPFVNTTDPDSSITHYHHGDLVASAASPDVLEMPLDDEANFRKPSPNPKGGTTARQWRVQPPEWFITREEWTLLCNSLVFKSLILDHQV